MRTSSFVSIQIALGLVLLLGGGVRAAAAESDPVAIELEAHKVEIEPDGSERLSEAVQVQPGDVVEYRATYSNAGAEPVDELLGTLPIPHGTAWLPGSASPARVTASLDGVKFEAPPLKREMKRADGGTEVVDVPIGEYRFLRWNLDELAAGERRVVSARVQVNP